ncbi:MAG: GNAT family N-acetyltransferase [Oscillospiraceae bacterium]|nr:GNAT family N-acetyltransferase [Oscillospiraceae bacterium]
MEYRILKLSELSEAQAERAFELFAEGFFFIFSPISKDKAKLRQLFMDSFDRQSVFVCLYEGEVAGFLAWGDHEKQPIRMRKETCLRLFGRLKGSAVYQLAGGMLSKPKVKNGGEGYLDYLTTDPAFRGRGVGTRLLRHMCAHLPYDSFFLEVLSKNENAIRLYQKLGFKKVKTKNDPFAMLVGYGRPILMRSTKKLLLQTAVS